MAPRINYKKTDKQEAQLQQR